MTEVTLAKRIITLALIALVVMGAAACTREKPPVTEPTPTGVAALEVTTPPTVPGGGAAVPTTPAPLILGTPAPSATPLVPAIATVPGTAIPPAVITTAPTAAATSTPAPPPGTATTYTVQWGDWLNKIAVRFGVTTQAIVAANPGLDPNLILPGQVLNIPAAGAPVPTSVPGSATAVPPGGATAVPPPPSNVPSTYTVQRGDWFYAIARKFGVSVSALQAANRNINPNFVYPGQVLNIPGGTAPDGNPPPPSGGSTYTVQRGDTLFSIAVRVGRTVYALQIANRLANPNFIYPGQTLVIP